MEFTPRKTQEQPPSEALFRFLPPPSLSQRRYPETAVFTLFCTAQALMYYLFNRQREACLQRGTFLTEVMGCQARGQDQLISLPVIITSLRSDRKVLAHSAFCITYPQRPRHPSGHDCAQSVEEHKRAQSSCLILNLSGSTTQLNSNLHVVHFKCSTKRLFTKSISQPTELKLNRNCFGVNSCRIIELQLSECYS